MSTVVDTRQFVKAIPIITEIVAVYRNLSSSKLFWQCLFQIVQKAREQTHQYGHGQCFCHIREESPQRRLRARKQKKGKVKALNKEKKEILRRLKQIPRNRSLMQESYWNNNGNVKQKPQEPFSQLQIPSHVPFYVRLNGRRFQAVSEDLKAEKPFDEKFAKCLVACGKSVFQSNLAPTLVFVASDEVNALFAYTAPFNLRVEKINSVLASTASSAFSLNALKRFNKSLVVAFDSRIAMTTRERLWEYLAWRQRDAWRNHNNAYAYWLLRQVGHKPSEAAKKLKGLKTKDLHELLFRHGINLAKTPTWQRRGILIHREPFQKRVKTQAITRWRIKENWKLPIFTTEEGQALIQQVAEWAKPENRGTDIA